MTRTKILKDLDRQDLVEGVTDDTILLRDFLDIARTSSQWTAFTKVRWHSYGNGPKNSYRFWLPTPELKKLYTKKSLITP